MFAGEALQNLVFKMLSLSQCGCMWFWNLMYGVGGGVFAVIIIVS